VSDIASDAELDPLALIIAECHQMIADHVRYFRIHEAAWRARYGQLDVSSEEAAAADVRSLVARNRADEALELLARHEKIRTELFSDA